MPDLVSIEDLSRGDIEHITRLETGESLLDTTRMAGFYCDAVVARHPHDRVMRQIKPTSRAPPNR